MKSLLDNFSSKEFIFIVKSSFSYADLAKRLGYKSFSGDLLETIKKKMISFGLSSNDFKPIKDREKISRTKENILCENSTCTQSTLRKFIINNLLLDYVCQICGQEPYWNNKKLTLILDHINGINNDNRLKNLRFVCPNCNQQLETTCRRKKIDKSFCIDCGKEISKGSTRCNSCSAIYRSKNKDGYFNYESKFPKEEFEERLYKLKNFKEMARIYVVSDNYIKKICKKYGLPSKTSELKGGDYGKERFCKICGIKLNNKTITGLCKNCYKLYVEKSKIPSKLELEDKFKELVSSTKVGEYYKVSRKTINNWKIKLGIV